MWVWKSVWNCFNLFSYLFVSLDTVSYKALCIYNSEGETSVMLKLLFFTLFSGKQVRTKLAQAFNHWLNVPEDKLQVRISHFKSHSESSDVYCCRRVQEGEIILCSSQTDNLFCNAARVFCQQSCSYLNVNVQLGFRAWNIHDLLQEIVNAAEDQVE